MACSAQVRKKEEGEPRQSPRTYWLLSVSFLANRRMYLSLSTRLDASFKIPQHDVRLAAPQSLRAKFEVSLVDLLRIQHHTPMSGFLKSLGEPLFRLIDYSAQVAYSSFTARSSQPPSLAGPQGYEAVGGGH